MTLPPSVPDTLLRSAESRSESTVPDTIVKVPTSGTGEADRPTSVEQKATKAATVTVFQIYYPTASFSTSSINFGFSHSNRI